MACLERFGATNDTIVTFQPHALGMKVLESDLVDIATELAYNRVLTSLDLSHCAMSLEAATAIGKTLKEPNRNVVSHLRLSKCGLNAQTIPPLAEILSKNQRIEAAEFSENSLRDEGALHIAKGLESNAVLRVLDLTSCKVGPAGAAALGGALKVNTRLKNLCLAANKLREAGTHNLCTALESNNSLSMLDLSGNNINREGGVAIANLLRKNKSLESLNLGRNYLCDSIPSIVSALCERNVPARLLDVSRNMITADVCKEMAQVLEGHQLSIACLSIERNAIANEGLIALYHALKGTGIQFLDISQCELTSHSCVVIADLITGCHSLNSIQMDGNDLGDESLREVALAVGGSKSLAALNLEKTFAGPLTTRGLAESLLKRRKLRSLILAENRDIGVDGMIPVLDSLGSMHTLEELDLSDTSLGDSEVLLQALVGVFIANGNLHEIKMEYNEVASGFANGIMTREYAMELLDTSQQFHGTGAKEGPTKVAQVATTKGASSLVAGRSLTTPANNSMQLAASAHSIASAHAAREQSLFRPTWATTVPMPRAQEDDDYDDADDGAKPPLIPQPDSLHNPYYPGYGKGRFSNGSLIQPLNDPLPFNVAVSHGTRPRFRPTSDGATLLSSAPRRAMKHSPYSLTTLENNAGMLPVSEDQLRRKFQELDVDGNGYLDREEFKAVYSTFQTFGIRTTEADVEAIFKKNCVWEDGKVSFDEFCILMLQLAKR